MRKLICLSMLLAGFLFAAVSVSAQEVARTSCNKEVAAACAKVCSKTVTEAKTPSCKPAAAQTQSCQPAQSAVVRTVAEVGQEIPAPSTAAAVNCDPADCPPLCKLLCPLICPQGTQTSQVAMASCQSSKPVMPAALHASAEPVKEQ